jgi:hypothetical protein
LGDYNLGAEVADISISADGLLITEDLQRHIQQRGIRGEEACKLDGVFMLKLRNVTE